MCIRFLIPPPTDLVGRSTWRHSHERLLSRAVPGLLALTLILIAAASLVSRASAQDVSSTSSKAKPHAANRVQPAPPKATAPPSATQQAEPPAAEKTPAKVNPPAVPGPSHQGRDNLLIGLFCAMTVLLVLYPVLRFVLYQWSFRKEKLLGALAGDAIVYYYRQFRAGAPILALLPLEEGEPDECGCVFDETASGAYMASFREDFTRWYGRKYYVGPVLMLAILSGVSGFWASEMLQTWAVNGTGPGSNLRALAASALAGAFVWVISDEIDRLRTRDFTTIDVYYYVFRILLAVPFAWALSLTNTNGVIGGMLGGGLPVAIPLAFFLGAFPTKTLFTIARRLAAQLQKLGDNQENANLELEKLQSIGKANAERFNDEGISTISGLAYADPIDLTIRTNFDFSYVVDSISQALAWIYFGDDSQKLFEFSFRGAQEICSVVQTADDPDDKDQERAQQTISEAAAKLNVPEAGFRSTLDQIAQDPYTKFLVNAWR
jgi:hypothetical protein